MKLHFFAALFAVSCLCSCTPQAALDHIVPKNESDGALHYIALLRNKDFHAIEQDIDPSIKTPELRSALEKMNSLLPAKDPNNTKVIGYYKYIFPTYSTTNITYEFQYADSWLTVNVVTKSTGTKVSIIGFNINPLPDSLENINRFTLSNKSPIQYFMLALTVIIPAFSIYALVLCIRTKLKKKWLWILFILFGIGQLSTNWTSGECFISFFAIQILGAGAHAQFYGPWILSISLPLGAILFILRRGKIGQKSEQDAAANP